MLHIYLIILVIQSVWADSIELTGSTFNELASKGTWFVEHFSPYCPHCAEFAPTWKQLASDQAHLAASNDFHFGTIDCTVQGDLCNDHDIAMYPQMQLYADGQLVETYSGGRSLGDLTSYTTEKASPHISIPSQPISPQVSTSPVRSDESIALNADTFSQVTELVEPWFVKFYTPWCPHCQRLAPTWDMLAKELQNTEIHVAEVNCQENAALCSENGVDGYPTLKLFTPAGVSEYRDDRSLAKLISFARKMAGPYIDKLGDSQELLDKLKDIPVAVIYLYKDPSDSSSKLLLAAAAEFATSRVSFFTLADSAQSLEALGILPHRLPALVIAKDEGQRFLTYTGSDLSDNETTKTDVINWIRSEMFPTVTMIDPTIAEDLLRGERMVVLAVMERMDQTSHEKLREMAERFQARFGSHVLFAWLDATLWERVARQTFGVTKEDVPALVMIDGPNKQYFDRDATRQRRFTLDDMDSAERGINTMLTGQGEGVSMLPIHSRIGHELLNICNYVLTHWMLFCMVLTVLFTLLYKVRRSKSPLFPVKQEVVEHRD